MEKLFVPYEIAKQLKNKGFNEPCLAYYSNNGFDKTFNTPKLIIEAFVKNDKDGDDKLFLNDCLAPLYQQVVDWLREKHNLHIEITCYSDSNHYDLHWYYSIVNLLNFEKGDSIIFNTYQEALDSAISEALKLV